MADQTRDAARAYADAYKVSAEQVVNLRQSGMGWGEIEIALSLAEQIRIDSGNKIEIKQALQVVIDQRRGGSGWGRIAKDHKHKLGDVVSGKHSPPKKGVKLPKPVEREIVDDTCRRNHIERPIVERRREHDASFAEIQIEIAIAVNVSVQKGDRTAVTVNQTLNQVVKLREQNRSIEDCAREFKVDLDVATKTEVNVVTTDSARPGTQDKTSVDTEMKTDTEIQRDSDRKLSTEFEHQSSTEVESSSRPAAPAQPAEPAEPAQPAQPTSQSSQPTQPAEPAQPAQPAQPAEQPSQPAQPNEPPPTQPPQP